MSGLTPQRNAPDAALTPTSEGESAPPTRARRALWFVALAVVFVIGAAGGFALGFPAMVERAGRTAIGQLESRLGVAVSARAVDWTFGGDVDVVDLVVRDPAAPAGEAPLLSAQRVHIDSDVALFDKKVTLRDIHLEAPVVTVVRRADGSGNLRVLARRLVDLLGGGGEGSGGSGGGGALRFLERHAPTVSMAHARVVVDAPMPALPLGLSVPDVVAFNDGAITLKADVPDAPTEVALKADFAETSLDPGFGLGVELAVGLDGAPHVVGARFDRPVRFYLGQRVAGVKGFRWTPDGFAVNELQLSVPITPDNTGGTVGAAATVARLEVAPEPREILRRAQADFIDEGGTPGLRDYLAYIDKVVVVEPALVLRLAAGGYHSFGDLMPPLRWGAEHATEPVELLVAAARAASARLGTRKDAAEGGTFGSRVTGAATSLEALADTLGPRVSRVLGALPFKALEVRDGHVALSSPVGPMTLESLAIEASSGPEGARLVATAVVPEVTRRSARIALEAPRGEGGEGGVKVDVKLAGLPLSLFGDALPRPLTAEGDGVLYDSAVHFEWVGEGRPWKTSGTVQLRDAVLSHPDLAQEPLRAVDLGVDFDLRVDPGAQTLALESGRLRVRDVAVDLAAQVKAYRDRPVLHLDLRLPETSAQAVVDAFPRAMLSRLEGLTVTGTVAWTVAVDLDTGDIPAMTIDSRPVGKGFAVRSLGSIDFDQLRTAFSYPVRREDGADSSRMSGPLTGRWVPLEEISPYLEKAVTTTEDPFYKHPGFSTNAIQESIVTDLQRGAFVRGASTITQQLVKNLFLGPHKTLSRKLQEIFIAWQLEQNLDKSEIMALYLNVIEFGPGIYGVGDAADRWFGKSPQDLTLLECIFLSSIIPNPRRYYESFFQQGRVSPRWRKYLQALLGIMVERGKITAEEAEAQAPYEPVFRGAALLPLGPGGVELDPPLPDDDGGQALPMIP